jgi:uncharacterized protein (DUF934 family)
MAMLRFRSDPAPEEVAVTLDAFLAQPEASAVRLEVTDDARSLTPQFGRLQLVEVPFASFRDGRGYSIASILREAGYTGELRATGDVLVDQLPLMRRCGFDSFLPAVPIDEAVLGAAMARYADVYQGAADRRAPIWVLRHGTAND